jgi:hypothetical protein
VEEPVIVPADPVVDPPGEFSVGRVEVGTLNGSELPPSVGAVAAVTDVFDEKEGVSVKPAAPALDCVGPTVADAEEPVVPEVGLTGVVTWACATSMAASHVIITKMNIRSIGSPHLAER